MATGVLFEVLIGKQLADIRAQVHSYEEDGSIGLEQCSAQFLLKTGELFGIPDQGSTFFDLFEEPLLPEHSIFLTREKEFEISQLSSRHFQSTQAKNTRLMRNKCIVGIYEFVNGSATTGREWNKVLIELDSGFLFSEKDMAPMGTGQTGIWVFESKADVKRRIGRGFRQVAG